MRRLGGWLGLTAVYLLVLGSPKPADVAVGAVLSALLMAGLPRDRAQPPALPAGDRRRRWRAFPGLAWAVVADVAAGTWEVALIVLGVRRVHPGSAWVEVPIGERTREGVALGGILVTLSPGTVLVDVDWTRGTMVFHALDSRGPDVVRDRIERFYHERQRPVVP
jgi:multicomponent K+:H+ antiporter subunit E/multicomponent Na+:H+ antiporter subunit E